MKLYKLHFSYEYDKRLATEAKDRGHLGGVTVELVDGSLHSIFFFDSVRLTQELKQATELGEHCVAEKGMIVLTEITMDTMMEAVSGLGKDGFFKELDVASPIKTCSSSSFPKLHFDDEYDERLAMEARDRGYLGGVTVELANGSLHFVCFYDPVRLAQDLEVVTKQGRHYVAEKGMIVLPEVTLDNMKKAISELDEDGFFGT